MLTFKANLSDSTTVKKINDNCGYIITNHQVSVAELSPFSKNDRCTMKKIPYIWGSKGGDVHLISDGFEYTGDKGFVNQSSRYFALTSQLEDFCYLKPTQIMGLMQTTKLGKDKTELDFIHVNPFFVHNNPYSKFMGVGTAMLESLKKMFTNSDITLYSPKETIEFFRKNGYEVIKDSGAGDVFMKLKR